MEVQPLPRLRPRRPQSTTAVAAAVLAAAALGAVGRDARAQGARPTPTVGVPVPVPASELSTSALVSVGSVADERVRLGQLLGRQSTSGYLLRTASALTPAIRARPGTISIVGLLPELLVVRNSDIPTSDNDGALWAGRGENVLVRGGAALRYGRFAAAVVPEVAYSRNLGFQSQPATLGGQQPATGPFQAQWFTGVYSADLPTRFGDQSYAVVGLGQSYLSVDAGPVTVGLSSENQWWGPGLRNALLVSNAAEGLPHLFVRTARPLRTRLGNVEARWILGRPVGSLYFDAPGNVSDGRVVNGLVATLRVAADTGLTVGVARLVLTPTRGSSALGHAFDVLLRNQSLGSGDTLRTGLRSDQLASVFARWVLPDAGAEVYGEFARLELPRSLRDFLVAPLNTGAYTLGAGRAWRGPASGTFRGSLEVTNLEQSRTFTDRPPPPDYYTGRAAPRGFTNRGQPLGAAIGPGSQSQWAAFDYYAPRWQAGLFAQRTRNQNDALYRQFVSNAYRHDVSLSGGVRGGVRRGGIDARATLALTERLNYLFQNGTFNFLGVGSVDVRNLSLALSLSPAPRSPR